jgi:hypothetical protein
MFQAVLTLFAVQVATSIVDKTLHNSLEGILASLALGVLSLFLGTGFMLIALRVAKGEHASYKDILPHWRVAWHYFCASAVSGLLIVLGFIALIIPGIYLLLRYSMVRFAVLELSHAEGAHSITNSMRKSSAMTKGVKWKLLGFTLALIGLNILGALALVVGLLVTIPISAIAYAHVYLKLKGAHHS